MEKSFELPENCKGFTIKSLENGDFEIVYIIDKKVRVSTGYGYFFISSEGEIERDNEDLMDADNDRFNLGNYFINKELAEKALSYIKTVFDKFWENENKSSSN